VPTPTPISIELILLNRNTIRLEVNQNIYNSAVHGVLRTLSTFISH
jgi:hypothetical protein